MMRDRRLLGAGLAVLATTVAPGCIDYQEYLVVERTPSWTVEDSQVLENLEVGRCVVDPTVDVSFLHGLHDVGFGTPYALPFVLENRLLDIAGTTNATGVQQGEVQVLDVDVELTMPQAPEIIETLRGVDESLVEFNQAVATVSIKPGAEQGMSVDVISGWAADELRPLIVEQYGGSAELEIVASIVVNGRRSGSGDQSDEVSTREYRFPIKLCNRCLVDCSYCRPGDCPADVSSDDPDRLDGTWVGGVCGNAQDFLHIVPSSCVYIDE